MSKRRNNLPSRTHGRGRKAGRGPGKHGGTGNCGLNAHKKISVIKNPELYANRKGFINHQRMIDKIINLEDLNKYSDKISDNILNLTNLGYDKLLAKSCKDFSFKNLTIIVAKHSKKVIEFLKQNDCVVKTN